MKEITKELIDQTVSKISGEVSSNIINVLVDNIEIFQQKINESEFDSFKDYTLYIATMNTALQMSVEIMKESLYELLCKE